MPGTIQVSVLDFMGLQSSSPPSQTSIKVSMGKKEYQTWDKGEFSFPLTTLRDNLIVSLQDGEGNQISQTDVETRLVIEKGVWDEIFPLEGGGHVHLKLQFILSEEERHRIRTMRELALKKKHDEFLNTEFRRLEYDPAVSSNVGSSLQSNDTEKGRLQSEVVATIADLTSTLPSTVFKKEKSGPEDIKGTHSDQRQTSPNDTDRYEDSSSTVSGSQRFDFHLEEVNHKILVKKKGIKAPSIDVPIRTICSDEASCLESSGSAAVAAKNKFSEKMEGDGSTDPKKQSPLEKIPTNVRNMISAFESSMNQDTRLKVRPQPPIKVNSSKTGLEIPLRSSDINELNVEKFKPVESLSGRMRTPFHTGNEQRAPTEFGRGQVQFDSVGAFTEATSSQDTAELQELKAAKVQTKGNNVDSENKLKDLHKKVDIEEKWTSSEDSVRAVTGERASISGRMLNQHLGTPISDLFSRKRYSGGNLPLEKSRRGCEHNGSQEVSVQVASGDGNYSSECSGAWIFPDEGNHFCITSGGKQIMNLVGGYWAETKSQPGNISSSRLENVRECGEHRSVGPGTSIEAKEGKKTYQRLRKSEVEDSKNAETSRGPIGQVMRIAIMVGFATLVLLTRQRK